MKRTFYVNNPALIIAGAAIVLLIGRGDVPIILVVAIFSVGGWWWNRIVITSNFVQMVGASGLRRKFTPNQLIVKVTDKNFSVEYDRREIQSGMWMKRVVFPWGYKRTTYDQLRQAMMEFSQKKTNG